MARYCALPRDLSLGSKVSIVGGVGAPGRGVGLSTRAAVGTGSLVRVLGFDAELRPTSDVSTRFEDAGEAIGRAHV